MTGPVVYWKTDDLEAAVTEVEAAGGTVVRPVTAVGGGTSLALPTDPAGNPVGFITQGHRQPASSSSSGSTPLSASRPWRHVFQCHVR
jgi:hypothetical protein